MKHWDNKEDLIKLMDLSIDMLKLCKDQKPEICEKALFSVIVTLAHDTMKTDRACTVRLLDHMEELKHNLNEFIKAYKEGPQ